MQSVVKVECLSGTRETLSSISSQLPTPPTKKLNNSNSSWKSLQKIFHFTGHVSYLSPYCRQQHSKNFHHFITRGFFTTSNDTLLFFKFYQLFLQDPFSFFPLLGPKANTYCKFLLYQHSTLRHNILLKSTTKLNYILTLPHELCVFQFSVISQRSHSIC
jgi:hypothetical protein